MKKIVLLTLVVCFLALGCANAQTDRSAEVARLMQGLESGSQIQRVNAAKIISRSGLQDQDLYRKVAELLQAGYLHPYESHQTDEMAWLCKALAASGDSRYAELLKRVSTTAPSEKLKHYAQQSLGLIAEYARRNRVLNATDKWDADLTAEENRLANMLRSDIPDLRRDAAKVLTRKFGIKPKVYALAAESLQQMSQGKGSGHVYEDTMAWLCKALAASGDSGYVALLQQVHDRTQSVKLQSYSSDAIKALKRQ